MNVDCRFFGPFRDAVGTDRTAIETEAETYRDLLSELESRHPELDGELLAADGLGIADDTVVTKNGTDIRHVDGLDTTIDDGDVVRAVPSVYGGTKSSASSGGDQPSAAEKSSMIHILVYDGFDELDAVGPFEVFDYAREYGAVLEASYRTLEPTEQVTASHGTRIVPDGTLPEPDAPGAPDLLVVPGGGWNARDESASAWVQAERGEIPRALKAHHQAGARVAGVCTGAMLLSAAGITVGRPAVTHASALAELEAAGADVRDARVVDDGDLLTAGGVTSGLDLALHVVDELAGSEVADRVATAIEYERRFDVDRTASGD